MSYTITFPRTFDPLLGWLGETTLTAPEGWEPPGYHVVQCVACHEVMEHYSANDRTLVHRATGGEMCSHR